jgi:hypothetical protein
MKQQRKEFIIQAHSAACSDWKTKIEKEFPKLFKKDQLIVGKWYKYDDNTANALMVWNDSKETYGFWSGEYDENLSFFDEGDKVLATDKEVSKPLIKEAVKRGFDRSDINFKLIEGCVGELNEHRITSACEIVYQASSNALVLKTAGSLYTIFKNGVWAEIIKEKKPVYEWQYVYNSTWYRNKTTLCHYTSKKEFILTNQGSKPLHKVKESKRIRK